MDTRVEIVSHNDMSKDIQRAFLERIAKLDQPGLPTGVVDEKYNMWSPELDVFWPET